jgi:hypothetical protein
MIEVPSYPLPAIGSNDVAAIAGYLVGGLLAHAPASLTAESVPEDDAIIWRLCHASEAEDFYVMPSLLFRPVLARIGYYYMGSQLYGGEASVQLRQSGNEFDAIFSMRNSQAKGFGIKIIAKKRNEG